MIKLAFRNLWRNRRRTVITVASVFFAVFFSVIMMSSQEGQWNKMIENTLLTQTGHIQIHQKGYWDDKVIDNFMTMDAAMLARLESIPGVANISPRVESFAMASYGTVTKGIAVMGVDPAKEAEKSGLSKRLVEGDYLLSDDGGIIIGAGLSRYLKAGVGDTLALIGQGYHGASAVGLFPVRGIVKLFITEMDNGFVYMTLPAAQQFIDLPDGYSGILISLHDGNALDKALAQCKTVLQSDEESPYDVLPWTSTMERLLQQAESDKAISKIVVYILYLIVGFGILGTVIMMTNERRREFIVMISLGMSRGRLAATVATEMACIALMGVLFALMVSVPIAVWFNIHPIQFAGDMAKAMAEMGMEPLLPLSASPMLFVREVLTILVITALTTIFPVKKIMTMILG
jgi:ABC-type lipoprotein release transport system permease subunit